MGEGCIKWYLIWGEEGGEAGSKNKKNTFAYEENMKPSWSKGRRYGLRAGHF